MLVIQIWLLKRLIMSYVMEFKMGKAEAAILQIRKNNYYQKYQQSKKKVILVGIGFDGKERNIKDWLIEVL